MERVHHTQSEADTEALGAQLASELGQGSVVLLQGELGAGKTAFVRGLARGLGVSPEEVSSPTFTLLQTYRGRVPLHHADLYRLASSEVLELGLEDVGQDGVLAVEWAERFPVPPARAWTVTIADDVDGGRRIVVAPPDDGHSTR
jgi:tRNA threonylcarbamoyladenosine biosynthesis protein TsaE